MPQVPPEQELLVLLAPKVLQEPQVPLEPQVLLVLPEWVQLVL